ncbi:LysR substrate-binding domain-containing protein [Bradyrhizobium sp. CB1650]|uniref:LysR substrate-binding domain-containing protein n=1 Tax=Bradyrhizobium sp. CB1650 TaxID=3039153 RepID=UPI0024355174|nr:LysR substrate-binding domain-containing protein [Bradyrhizobium sp. CB1650]WGD50128.1 LysR substrate-binding domain-containing protein [Bradyrhizobium sp. CB1650]
MVDGDLRNDNLARKLAEEDIQHAVITHPANALQWPEDMRRCVPNELLRVDRMPHPSISRPVAHSRVALDARQLRYFIAVAEELSFAGAADRLNVAQSAVSLQIKWLEEAFGTRLLNRRKRAAVSITEAGRLFLFEAEAAIRQLERAEQVGRLAARGELGQIEVGYVTLVAVNRILPSLLREYRGSHPAVQLRLTAMETPRQLEALAEGRLDAALIRPRPSYAAGVAARVIHREALCVALAADHPLASSRVLRAAELSNEAFIVPHVATFGSQVERLAAIGRFPIKIVHDVGDFVTALSMAAAGYGVAMAPESMRGFGFPEVVFRQLADFAEEVELAVAFRAAEPSASVRAFIDAAIALGRRPCGTLLSE